MEELTCGICGYKWKPRTAQPKACPDCKSRDWFLLPTPFPDHTSLCPTCSCTSPSSLRMEREKQLAQRVGLYIP